MKDIYNELNYPDYYYEVNRLDILQKLEIYMDYFVIYNNLKHNFLIDYNIKEDSIYINKKYLWLSLPIFSFDEFISDKNVKIYDYGRDWKDKNVAQRYRVDCNGIYEWYFKFKNKFNF